MTQCIGLLRGINVGRAKRVPMAELRKLVETLGYSGVRTLLNSGNVVFEAGRPSVSKIAASIEAAIQARFQFPVPVVVVTSAELKTIIAENPLLHSARDPSKQLVAFAANSSPLLEAKALLAQSWSPDELAVGSKAAYLWCANGIIESKLMQVFSRVTRDATTTRNWATVLKLQAVVNAGHDTS